MRLKKLENNNIYLSQAYKGPGKEFSAQGQLNITAYQDRQNNSWQFPQKTDKNTTKKMRCPM